MSEDSAALTVTLKQGGDFASPWIVVRADNPSDMVQRLQALGDVVAATTEVAGLFKGAGNAAPLVTPQQQAPAQQAPQQSGGWGQAPQQQSAPLQQAPQGGGNRFGNKPPHPEGKACHCGKVLELNKTQSGKTKFQCPDWRWQNGNPNGHDMEWAN